MARLRPVLERRDFQDYTTSSESEAEQRFEDYINLQALTQHGHESIQDTPHCFLVCSHEICEAYVLSHLHDDAVREHECADCTKSEPLRTGGHSEPTPAAADHACLGQYARDLCGMMQGAMDNLVSIGGMESFPAYTEVDFIEGIDPYCPEHEHVASATQGNGRTSSRPRSDNIVPAEYHNHDSVTRTSSVDLQSLADNPPSSLGDGSPSNSSNVSNSTRPSSLDLHETGRPIADSLGHRRVRRTEACYFGVSEDLRDANGKPLITRKARDSKDV